MAGPRPTNRNILQATALAALTAIALGLLVEPALARVHHHYPPRAVTHHWARTAWHRPAPRRTVFWGSPTDPRKDAELVLDGKTGRVLFARNADAYRHPASLTKMMTLYMLFDALKSGRITMNTPIYISQHAASQYPTKLGLPAGSSLPVDVAIRAAVVLSANDIAVAIAEALGGTESHFGELMTQKARELGMRNTFYHNASGLPDDRQITTASDLGLLARHLAYDFPQYFGYFSLTGFTYRGVFHHGHDNLLGRYAGADGIKTGYTNASGFNLVSSVVRGGVHVIAVVMGGYSAWRRDAEMMRLLDQTFAQISQQPMLVARAQVPWQTVAEASTAQPMIAGFAFNNNSLPAPAQQQYASITPRGEMDEETAESRPDQDEIAKLIQNAPPQPRVGAQPTPLRPTLTSPPPQLRTSTPPASPPQTSVAMLPPTMQQPKPQTNFATVQPPPAPRQQASPVLPPAAKPQPNIAAATPPKPQPVQVAVLSAPAQVKLPDVKPIPSPAQALVLAQANIPNVMPLPRDNTMPVTLASYQPQSVPDVTPIPRASVASDVVAALPSTFKVTTAPGTTTAKIAKAASTSGAAHAWTIQIGAFGDIPTARAQLAAYAQKSMEALAHAERIIVPFQGNDGKTMYRARFGTFAEPQARSICARLLDRGQTCFPASLAH
jgi:D-alanyl-D-alanine carboxypeptidase